MSSLNPVQKVSKQIAEPILLHEKVSERVARTRVGELLEQVGIAPSRMDQFPHQFSGGQKQRIMIAMALACRPKLILADEPTTALDVMVQAQVLALLADLVRDMNLGMILITHDLSVLAQTCDRAAIMYAGKVVENGRTSEVFGAPSHPYAQALAGAFPRIGDQSSRYAPRGLGGDPPHPADLPTGCTFHPRCPVARDECRTVDVKLWPAGVDHSAACVLVRDDVPDTMRSGRRSSGMTATTSPAPATAQTAEASEVRCWRPSTSTSRSAVEGCARDSTPGRWTA